jgi:hypothetical protein
MERINFVNNQEPALNAANLNQLQTNIENAINEKNMITASFTGNYTIKSTDTEEKIILDSTVIVGDKLSLTEDGGILIGENVSKIKVSANVNFQTITDGAKYAIIHKNNETIVQNVSSITDRTTLSISPIVCEVTQNDVVYLGVRGITNDLIRRGMQFSNITVEVII